MTRIEVPPSSERVEGRTSPVLPQLDGYQIQGVLARSSFAVVYRAFDPALTLQVAIKEYLPEALALRDAEGRVVPRADEHAEAFELGLQAFVAEAELLARCRHGALLRVLRLMRCHGTVYRVMPCCACPTLLEHRQALAAPPAAQTLRTWLDDLLGALQTLHAEGCVHGAVAPANILLQPDGRPLLLDLDAVRGALISDRTLTMMAALRPCFEPIEQRAPVSYMVVGPWTDLYSLAATLHFCIGGQLPPPPHAPSSTRLFEPLAEVWQRARGAHSSLDAAPAWLPALDRCLCEDPQDRPRSVAELISQFDERCASAPLAAPCAAVAIERPPAAAAESLSQPGQGAAEDAQPASGDHRVASEVAPEPAPAPASASAAQPATQDAPPAAAVLRRRWLRPVGATAVLVLATVVAIIAWAPQARDAEAPSSAPPVRAAASPDAALPPPRLAAPAPEPPAASEPPPVEPPAASQPPVAQAPDAPATPPAAPAERAVATPKAGVATSPRQLCGGRVRYALLQCMQAQCAKKAWTQHEQCRRLRQENRLS